MTDDHKPRADPERMFARFVEGFHEAEPNQASPVALNEDFLANEANRMAVINGLAQWAYEAQHSLPEGLGLLLVDALLAMRQGEETWLRPRKRHAGERAKQRSRERFDYLFCREIEFLRGWFDSEGIAFFETTGKDPRRNGETRGRRDREGQYKAIPIEYEAYQKMRQRVLKDPGRKESLDFARATGEALRKSWPNLTVEQAEFLVSRSKMLAGEKPALWSLYMASFKSE